MYDNEHVFPFIAEFKSIHNIAEFDFPGNITTSLVDYNARARNALSRLRRCRCRHRRHRPRHAERQTVRDKFSGMIIMRSYLRLVHERLLIVVAVTAHSISGLRQVNERPPLFLKGSICIPSACSTSRLEDAWWKRQSPSCL